MQEISCPPFFIYKKILISTLVFFIGITSVEVHAASDFQQNLNTTSSVSGNRDTSFQYPSLSNLITLRVATPSKHNLSLPGTSNREIAVAGPTISLIGNVQPRELILRNSESSLFSFPSFFSLQITRYKMPRLAQIELLPVKKYVSFALGANTVRAAEELSTKKASLPFIDQLSLSFFCALAPRKQVIDSRRCDYQTLASGRLDLPSGLATNINPSAEEPSATEELPAPTEVATTNQTPPLSPSSPIYLTRYITSYIGIPGPAGKDGTDGKDGVNGITSSAPEGYGSYLIPSYSSPATSIGVSTISYLRQTTIELPVITGGTATNLSLITPTVQGGVFSGLSLFNDSASFTGSVTINNLTATSTTVTNLTATNATTTTAYIDVLTVGSSTAGSLTLSGTLNVAGTSTLATTTASSFTATYATTTNLFTQNLSVGNASTTGNQSIDGQFNVSGTSTLGAKVFLNGSVVVGTSTDELFTVNALVNSNITPSQNITYDLGSASFYWRNLYANNINVNSISAASTTISGTSNNDFIVNSDNGSSDAEDASLVFFRGLSTPNALIRWNSATKRIESNMSFKVQNETPTTGTTTLTVQAGAGQSSTNLFELLNNAGTKLSAFTSQGWLGIGTTTPSTSLHLTTNDGLIIPAGTTAQRPSTTLPGVIRYNTTNTGFEGFNGSTWGSLGGVSDADQNTYISAENSAGANNDELKFYTAGTLRGIFSSTGNFGVGTSTPGAKLTVDGTLTAGDTVISGSGNANGLTIKNGTTNQAYSGGLTLASNDGTSVISRMYASTAGLFLSYGGADIGAFTGSGLSIVSGATYKINGATIAQASTTLNNYFFGNSGNLTMTGNYNTATGYTSLFSNTTGSYNTANGAQSLYSNTTGSYNTANGSYSLIYNTTGNFNTANGSYSLQSNTTGGANTANGYASLNYNTTGSNNTANGSYSLNHNTTGTQNTANGMYSLYSNTTGSYNTANGYQSLNYNTTGTQNTANGMNSLYSNTTGSYNTANGMYSLYSNTTGTQNTANGYASLNYNTTGSNNTANGVNALFSNTTGSFNTAFGYQAGYGDGTVNQASIIDNYMTFLGYQASRDASVASTTALTNGTAIGKNARVGASNTIVLGGTGADAVNVGIGTVLPTSRLNVVGTTTLVGSSTSSTALHVIGNIDNTATSTFAPRLISSPSTGVNPGSVFVSGRYAYTANFNGNSMSIIDISNPASPATISTPSTGSGSGSYSVFVSGRYAYVANVNTNSMSIIDISNPASPTVVATSSTGAGPYSVFVSGRYAYTANQNAGTISIIDISNPTSPITVATPSTGATPRSVFVSGRYAYVANSGGSSMSIIDISNPASPVTVSTPSTGAGPQSVFVSGRYAYVANNASSTMSIIDIKNPASAVTVATPSTGAGPQSVFVSGRYAYVANNSANTMSIIDVSNPSSPVTVSTPSTGAGPFSVFVSGRYAYVANNSASSISILDLGGIESTSAIIHSLTTGNLSVNNDIFANGNIVANGGLTIASGFQSQNNSSVYGSLNVSTANSVSQLRLGKTSSVYADLTLDSGGDLTFTTTGYNVKAMSNNLYICDNAGCPTLTATSTAGNIFVENAQVFGNNFSINQTSSTSLGMFDHSGSLIMTFDEAP